MRSLTVIFTGFCVLWHSVLGCCAAHVPAGSPSATVKCCTNSATTDCAVKKSRQCKHDVAHEDCHSTSLDDGADHHQPESPAEHECRHDYCQWLVGNSGSHSFDFQIEFLACVCFQIQLTLELASLNSSGAFYRDQIAFQAPLRLYLEFGAMLI